MKNKVILSASFMVLFFLTCKNSDGPTTVKSENDIDAARNFIHSALVGDLKKARTFILNDSLNQQYIDAYVRLYNERISQEDKMGYREASINIHSVKQLNDSTTIINYSNSYKNKNDSLKVIRVNGEWLVDLKYSFYNQADSLP